MKIIKANKKCFLPEKSFYYVKGNSKQMVIAANYKEAKSKILEGIKNKWF